MTAFLDPAIWAALAGSLLTLGGRYLYRFLQVFRYRADRRQVLRTLESADLESGRDGESHGSPTEIKQRLPADNPLATSYFYVTDLTLANFRCFEEATLSFRFPGEKSDLHLPNVNLFLGDNGSGKSSILRAIAMLALAPILEGSGFVPYRLVRQNAAVSRIEAAFVFGGSSTAVPLSSRIEIVRRGDFELLTANTKGPYWPDLFNESSPSFFIAGYGVNRRVADDSRAEPSLERGRRRRRYQRVVSLFDASVVLTSFGSWLPGLSSERQKDVTDILTELLPQGARFTGAFEGEQPIFERNGIIVPFKALSDGFRSYIGWLSDLLFQLTAVSEEYLSIRETGGIVLVDEIDLLLHPAWQRSVVPTISKLFPSVQFFFTSHSPIVTGTLQSGNIAVIEEVQLVEGRWSSEVNKPQAEVHGLNAEQVLMSSYFELESSRSMDVAADLKDLANDAMQGDEEARQRYFKALIGDDESEPTA